MAQDCSMLRKTITRTVTKTSTTSMNDPAPQCDGHCRPMRRGTSPSSTRQECKGFCSGRKGILVLVSLMLSWATTSSAAVATRWYHQQHRPESDGILENTVREDQQYNQRRQAPELHHYQQQQQQKQRRDQSSAGSGMERTVKFVYHDNPQLHWMQRLERPASLQRGNAVVASPFDETLLYVTTSTGKIFAISALNGTTMWEYTPPNKAVLLGTEEPWETYCKSGVAFGEIDTVGKFLVYAVIDIPPANSINAHQR
jgi:hypothetical protein